MNLLKQIASLLGIGFVAACKPFKSRSESIYRLFVEFFRTGHAKKVVASRRSFSHG
jgi:hypothetical protein